MRTHDSAVRVMIVDDHSMLVDALKMSLETTPAGETPIEVIVALDLTHNSVLDLALLEQPDVVLLDVDLGTDERNVDLVAPLTRSGHSVVLFTGWNGAGLLGDAIEAGAAGILRKSDTFDRLLGGIRDAAAGRSVTPPAERDSLVAEARRLHEVDDVRAARLASLTPRELHVLERLTTGSTAEQIASDETISLSTVRTHIKAILRKLEVSSQLAAVASALGR